MQQSKTKQPKKASLLPSKENLSFQVMVDYFTRSPFWLKSTTNPRHTDLFRRRASSIFFNLGSLVLLILIAAFLFLVFAIPSLIRHSSQTFKPSLVKRSWDWINLVLVLFALAFGFLSRIRNEDRGDERYQRTGLGSPNGAPKSNPSTTNQEWCGFSDQTVGELRRNRNSSSYPDLRELAVAGRDPWRFSDDTHLNSYRVWDSDHPYRRASWKELDRQNSVSRDDLVGLLTKVSYASPPSKPLVTSAPPAAKMKTQRTYQSLGYDQERMGRKGHASSEPRKIVAEEPEDPPPELPSAAPVMVSVQEEMDQRNRRSDQRRRGGNATKNFMASFSIKNKKKRKKYRSDDSLDALLHHPQQPPLHFQFPPPSQPPQPPPLPPSAFYDIFTSKQDKRKKNPPTTWATYSYIPPPPPPMTEQASRPTILRAPFTSQKPPMPAKIDNIDNWSGGGESPMRPIPPPPLPSFKMADLKYVVEGDYARLFSINSFHNGPSDTEEVETVSSDGTPNDGDVTPSLLFCPSPDVDTKAGSFIAKVRAGMKLEKLNSYNKKQALTMSNLGPTP